MKETAIVTGASGGIGAAIVRALARRGISIAAFYNSSALEAQRLKAELSAEGCTIEIFKADARDSAQVNKAVLRAAESLGEADILVNNAGIAQQKLFTDITDEDFDNMLSSNLGSAFYFTRAALPAMIRKKHGRIINISSMWGVCGASCEVHYSASKAALIGMTKALAKEVGPSGITVNCVAPGFIDTKMNASLSAETFKELCEQTPLGRAGIPEDVAAAVSFLASEEASFITGQILGTDGGII